MSDALSWLASPADVVASTAKRDAAAGHEALAAIEGVIGRWTGATTAIERMPAPGTNAVTQLGRSGSRVSARILTEGLVYSFVSNAWACVECVVYAANVMGWAAKSSPFLDIRDPKKRKSVSPALVWKGSGYDKHFPRMWSAFKTEKRSLQHLSDLFVVGKHRKVVAFVAFDQDLGSISNQVRDHDPSVQRMIMHASIGQLAVTNIVLAGSPTALAGETKLRDERLDDVVAGWHRAIDSIVEGFVHDAARL